MRIFIEGLNAFVGQSIIGDVQLVEVKVAAVEHLFESVVSDVVIDDVK